MAIADLVTWLQERSALNILEPKILEAIAPLLEEITIGADEKLVTVNTEPTGLYIFKKGQIESQSECFKSIDLLPGSVINLRAFLLNQSVNRTVIAFKESQFWFLSADKFRTLVTQFPEIKIAFSEYLAETVDQLSLQLFYEQEKTAVLRPYLVSKAKRGVIGKSRYVVKLRSQIKEASENGESVLIFGEPGLEKDTIAALIHFGSKHRHEPLVKIDCSKLQTSGAELFGRVKGKPGLIAALGKGTLILNNIEKVPVELILPLAQLLKTGTYNLVNRPGESNNNQKLTSQARLIMISEKILPGIDKFIKNIIKVPPLRVRKADIEDLVNYYITLICRAKKIKKPYITPEAIRHLQAYDFPNNTRELQNLVERAIIQLGAGEELTEEIIWPSQSKKKEFRVNLLNSYPQLRHFLRSNWWPDNINYGFTVGAFALMLAILFIGPQNREENFALNLFWAWWWPLVLIGFPFVGRLWCAICPFMIYGEITQKLSLWLFPRKLKKWPRQSAEKYGGWFLFGLFALILLWEEIWNLENTAYLSACLLLLITAGAMIFSAIFERRFWCRYLCPIGGMNGMFAKLSMIELRAQQGTCSAECTTYQCYKGGPEKGEGMASLGCPLYSHPAQLEDNRDCVLCMTCLKACPHRSVELNLRPPAIELWTTHLPRSYEVALLFLLLNVVFLHHLPEVQTYLGLSLDLTQFWTHLSLSLAALFLPVLIPLLGYGVTWLLYKSDTHIKARSFVDLAYGFLPLVLAGNIAHYLPLGLGEAGEILPVSFATFGLNGESLPILITHPAVINFLQGTSLIMGAVLAILLTQKIARQPFKFLLPIHLSSMAITVIWWTIIVRP